MRGSGCTLTRDTRRDMSRGVIVGPASGGQTRKRVCGFADGPDKSVGQRPRPRARMCAHAHSASLSVQVTEVTCVGCG